MDDRQIGWLLTTAIVVRTIATPWIAQGADRAGRRVRTLMILSALATVAFVPFGFVEGFWPLMGLSFAFGILFPPLIPLIDNLTVLAARQHGLRYGRIRLWGSMAFLLAAIGIGAAVKEHGPELVYWVVLCALGSAALLAPLVPASGSGAHRPAAGEKPIWSLLTNRSFVSVVAIAGLLQASHAAYYGFSTLHWTRNGIGEDVVGWLWAEGVVAEIETRAAIENLPAIIEASGAVMVARGDLGSECSIEELPILQKEIIRQCIALGRPAITATQMLETMVANPEPTRAEASDVANAVWDGSSAVMLSGETAIGVNPVNVVATMSRIAERADDAFDHRGWMTELSDLRMTDTDDPDTSITDAMTQATARAVAELRIGTILCISGSGFTVRSMARFRPAARIIGLSSDERTVGQLTLSWGTQPIHLPEEGNLDDRVNAALEVARNRGAVAAGELVGVLAGTDVRSRSTNALRIERVPEA